MIHRIAASIQTLYIFLGLLLFTLPWSTFHFCSRISNNLAVANTIHNSSTSLSTKEVLSLILEKSFFAKSNSIFLTGRSTQGAMILTDKLPSDQNHAEFNTAVQKIGARVVNYKKIQMQVPFNITRWTGVYTGPCPIMPRAHYAERGLSWAHYRIWRDFAYFDPVLELKYEKWRQQNASAVNETDSSLRKVIKAVINNSTNRNSHSHHPKGHGSYIIDKNFMASHDHLYRISLTDGKRYRGEELLQHDDVLVVFEDDAISTVKDLAATLQEELKDLHSGFLSSTAYSYMAFDGNLPTSTYFNPKLRDGDIYGGSSPHENTDKSSLDIIYLGWCEGRLAKPAPICSHAYAITRFAARKLVQYLEPCGEAIDLQMANIIKNGWLRFRRANSWSYSSDKIRPDYSEAGSGNGFKDFGIFRQCKSNCGSFLSHRV